jgi:guanyl-specific ribonuclease Sa
MPLRLTALATLLAVGLVAAAPDRKEPSLPRGVPAKVARVLHHVDEHDAPPPGYQGGRHFGNFEGNLPKKDRRSRFIKYREWDVNPRVEGKNRGAERLVTGSDGSAWYTADHYRTFKRIR